MVTESDERYGGYEPSELLAYVHAKAPERRPFTCERIATGVRSPAEAEEQLSGGFSEFFEDSDWRVDWVDAVESADGTFTATVHASYDPQDRKRRAAAAYWSEQMEKFGQSSSDLPFDVYPGDSGLSKEELQTHRAKSGERARRESILLLHRRATLYGIDYLRSVGELREGEELPPIPEISEGK